MPISMQRATLPGGIELDYQDAGPRDAPAIVFLHGFPESHRTWRHQVPHFARDYRCIAPDQRGYRGSSKPTEVSAYRPAALIGDVFALADAAGIGAFTLVGHDWGGAIAWGAGMMGQAGGPKAGRVERLAILNAPHPAVYQRLLYTDPQQRAASQYIRAFRDPANDALVRDGGLAPLLQKAVNWGGAPALEPEERERMLADWRDPAAAFAMLNWYRASTIDVPLPDAPLAVPAGIDLPDPPRLTIPTLVVWALEDRALPPANLDGLEQWVADLTIERVPDCGHFVPWEAPEAVNAALDRFLANTGAA